VLPELATYGPKLASAEPAGGRAEAFFQKLAREQAVWLMPGSLYQSESNGIFNIAPVIDPAGRVIARYRKMFPFRPFEEGVTAGDGFCVVPLTNGCRVGISICYDLWFPEVSRSLACLGAEALICPTLTDTIDRDVELAMARATAAQNQCYVVNVNSCAPRAKGRSIVCGPGGEVIYQAGDSHDVFVFEIDFDYVAQVRAQGWQGLGQPLKSFRDCATPFPAYQPGATTPWLEALGPIQKRPSRRVT
jgi:predicted amidohydrolase